MRPSTSSMQVWDDQSELEGRAGRAPGAGIATFARLLSLGPGRAPPRRRPLPRHTSLHSNCSSSISSSSCCCCCAVAAAITLHGALASAAATVAGCRLLRLLGGRRRRAIGGPAADGAGAGIVLLRRAVLAPKVNDLQVHVPPATNMPAAMQQCSSAAVSSGGPRSLTDDACARACTRLHAAAPGLLRQQRLEVGFRLLHRLAAAQAPPARARAHAAAA